MKISIITATYNSQEQILATYKSICSQSYSNWEWFVTDDCSDDDTLKLLESIEREDKRVHIFFNETNSGAAVSRNNSLSHAKGDFLAFIDSDDLWHPDKLLKQVSFMNDNCADFSFTSYELIDQYGDRLGKSVDVGQEGSFDYEDILRKKATVGCSTVMIRKSAFKEIKMPLLRTGQDYATWLSLLKTGKKAFVLGEVLTMYRILPNSISRNKVKKALRQWEIYRKVECLSLYKSIECFGFYAFRAVFRK